MLQIEFESQNSKTVELSELRAGRDVLDIVINAGHSQTNCEFDF